MDACEPRVRRRGFFLHSDTTGELETGELESPEGFATRARVARTSIPLQVASVGTRTGAGARLSEGRSRVDSGAEDPIPQLRSGSVTGSHQRADWSR